MALQAGVVYAVSVPAGAFVDHAGNASPLISWQFTTVIASTGATSAPNSGATTQLADTGLQISVVSIISVLLLVTAASVYRRRTSS